MKKNGYTLAEALIALGIVGVVAALMLPLMNKYKPDADKALFVRTYDSIVDATSSLVEDETIYPYTVAVNNPAGCKHEQGECYYWDYTRGPLLNSNTVTLEDGTKIQGGSLPTKYCNALKQYMHVANSSCSQGQGAYITLVNNVNINFYERKYYPNEVFIRILLLSGKAFYLETLPNGQVIPDVMYIRDVVNDYTIPYLITRTNWKKGKEPKSTDIDEAIKRYEDVRNHWLGHISSSSKLRVEQICRDPDGKNVSNTFCK